MDILKKDEKQNNFSNLQLEILKIMREKQIILFNDLVILLEKPRITVYDSIFINKVNLSKFIIKIHNNLCKKGRPKTILKYDEVLF